MANELCASGFTGSLSGINGNYQLMFTDHWSNGTYWIYKDSYFWMISTSPTLYEYPDYLKAIKTYIAGSWADGDYHAIVPVVQSTTYTEGVVLGHISLGTC